MELKQENIQTQPTYLIGVDTVAYSSKPEKGIMGWIKNRLAKATENTTVTVQDIITAVKQGQSICPAELDTSMQSHCAKAWKSQQIFFVDIDNAAGKDENGNSIRIADTEYISVNRAQQILKENNINAFFIYKSFSYKSDFEKFRICIRLNKLITNSTEREHIINALIHIFGKAADESCTNRDRIFYGSTPDCSLYENTTAVTDKQIVLTLYNKLFPKSVKPFTPPQLPTTQKQLSDTTEWYHKYDYDIDKLLYCLDPNADYETWKQATLAYKLAGGDKETWMDWSMQSPKWDEKTDPKLWDNIGNNGALQNNYLKKLAKQTIEGQRYMDDMKQAQQNAKQQFVEHQNITKSKKHQNAADATIKILKSKTDIDEDSLLDENIVNISQTAYLDDFDPQFLFYPYVPKDEYTVLLAESGIGKSTFCCGLAAAISTGTTLPWETEPREVGRVLYITTEDSSECIKTRAGACGGNLLNIYSCCSPDAQKMAFYGKGLIRLKKAIQTIMPSLIIFDPWQSFINQSMNINNMAQMREALSVVPMLAKSIHCGIILISHVTKNSHGENANNAASGSTELINMARSAIKLEYASDPDNKDNIDPKASDYRLAVHTKTNYAKLGKSLLYKTNNQQLTWLGFSNITRSIIEDAAKQSISVHTLMKKQDTTKSDYKLLIQTIVDISTHAKAFPITILYDELEKYNTADNQLWNGSPSNQKSKILKDLNATLQPEYHLSLYVPATKQNHFRTSTGTGRGFQINRYIPED